MEKKKLHSIVKTTWKIQKKAALLQFSVSGPELLPCMMDRSLTISLSLTEIEM